MNRIDQISRIFGVSIGSVSTDLSLNEHDELVPISSLDSNQENLAILRWMLQKQALGQDMFLLGGPNNKRAIVMKYCQLVNREVEYVAISRDTTDSDLKQRREIILGTACYYDQGCVRAAIHGRVLVLDGVEKAERNVLPLLNNLLENREMALDDGRFLVHPKRYDSLVKSGALSSKEVSNLVRVSEHFIVVALGLPVPKYEGFPLDPPFRSRFQCRHIPSPSFENTVTLLTTRFPRLSRSVIDRIVAASLVFTQMDPIDGTILPEFPSILDGVAHILQIFIGMDPGEVLQMVYPHPLLGTMDPFAIESLGSILAKFQLESLVLDASLHPKLETRYQVKSIKSDKDPHFKIISMIRKDLEIVVKVPSGPFPVAILPDFTTTPFHRILLSKLIMAHSTGDFCLIGDKGVGKSVVLCAFSHLLGYDIDYVPLFKDMSARDLLQRRSTTDTGDTSWENSGLVKGALNGSIVVLDPIDVLPFGVLASIQRLISEREITLPDGSYLIHPTRYAHLLKKGLSIETLKERRVYPTHPSFRIVAIARPISTTPAKAKWLSPEIQSMFLFVPMRPMSFMEEMNVIVSRFPNVENDSVVKDLLVFANQLRVEKDETLKGLAGNLSTRQLMRLSKRISRKFEGDDLASLIKKACLYSFLPTMGKQGLDKYLKESKIESVNVPTPRLAIQVIENTLKIGSVECPVSIGTDPRLVPDILFYENARQTKLLQDILVDYMLGEHVLLIGNQGVGKNKVVDRFLQLLNLPREYMQLHRDTTVFSLTCNPAVVDGRIVFEDSPLVKSVKYGYILVVDEADKAPTHVTAILKTLVEDHEMVLADGRRIVSPSNPKAALQDPKIILIHPHFRLFALANRPGFPFLGNDFFREIGDVFATHCVENADEVSEKAMLKMYAPNVPDATLDQLISAFRDLRKLVDEGTITYPYSTRELVNIVKHLEKYPEEGISRAFLNVFDFDVHDGDLKDVLNETMTKHGIPIGLDAKFSIDLASVFPLPPLTRLESWKSVSSSTNPIIKKAFNYRGEWRLQIPADQWEPIFRIEGRSTLFSELLFTVRLNGKGEPMDLIQSSDGYIYIVTLNPVTLQRIDPSFRKTQVIDLYEFIPTSKGVRLRLVEMSPTLIAVHNSIEHSLIHVNLEARQVTVQLLDGFDPIFETVLASSPMGPTAVIYQKETGIVSLLHSQSKTAYYGKVGVPITSLFVLSSSELLAVSMENPPRRFILHIHDQTMTVSVLHRHATFKTDFSNLEYLDSFSPSEFWSTLSPPNVHASVGTLSKGEFLSLELDGWIRENHRHVNKYLNLSSSYTSLKKTGQFVSLVPNELAANHDGILEIVDPGAKMVRKRVVSVRIHPDAVTRDSIKAQDAKKVFPNLGPVANLYELMDGNLVMLDRAGQVSVFQTRAGETSKDLDEWKRVTGVSPDSKLELILPADHPMNDTFEHGAYEYSEGQGSGSGSGSGEGEGEGDGEGSGQGGGGAGGSGGSGEPGSMPDPEGRKAGVITPDFQMRTAGQVAKEISDAQMDLHKARLASRLKTLEMTEKDYGTFLGYKKKVQKEIRELRAVLESVEAKNKERVWIRNRTGGDLDETRLVEGLAGERAIFKTRGENEYDPTFQEKPKKLWFVFDLSASMMRFNGHDGRMDRSMETAVMIMEAFKSFEHKFSYRISAHSGDGPDTEFVKEGQYPKNEKDIFKAIARMQAHAAYCISGDHTIRGCTHAIEKIVKEEADDYFVVVLSDANLSQYSITPDAISKALKTDAKVNAFMVFIGSITDQADQYAKKLPGNAFVCLNTTDLPKIMKSIFLAAMVK